MNPFEDHFIQGRRVIHWHAELLVTDNRIVWEQVGLHEAVCAAVPPGDVDLAESVQVRAEVDAFRPRRVAKTVEIVTKIAPGATLGPANGARRRLMIRRAKELARGGGPRGHQFAAHHYRIAGLGLLARLEYSRAATQWARQGQTENANRCRRSADEIDPIWGEKVRCDCDDDDDILDAVLRERLKDAPPQMDGCEQESLDDSTEDENKDE